MTINALLAKRIADANGGTRMVRSLTGQFRYAMGKDFLDETVGFEAGNRIKWKLDEHLHCREFDERIIMPGTIGMVNLVRDIERAIWRGEIRDLE